MKTKEIIIAISPMNRDKVKNLRQHLVDQAVERLIEIIGEEETDKLLDSEFGYIILDAACARMSFSIIKNGPLFEVQF